VSGSGGKPVAVLLRAVNLAGRRLVMADFKAALESLGYPGAQTVVATGNAVIAAKAADAALETTLQAGLARELGQAPDVFVRDGAQLAAIMRANPFQAMAQDNPSHMVVMFLKGDPDPAAVEALRGKIKGPEEVAVGPGCLYATYPEDIGHSKLTGAMMERALKLSGTTRNWNTVVKLARMTG
jgi:uncharacterized protein (DUF1697 family)